MTFYVFILSGSRFIPRELQLAAALAEHKGLDYEVNSGTSTGKTHIIALLHIYDPNCVSIVITPTKRLQITQVYLFFWIIVHIGNTLAPHWIGPCLSKLGVSGDRDKREQSNR